MNLLKFLALTPVILMTGCATTQVATQISDVSMSQQKVIVTIGKASYKTEDQLRKYTSAMVLVGQVINSDELKSIILDGPENQKYVVHENEPETKNCENGERTTFSYNVVDGKCHSNSGIYSSIQNADWTLNVRVNSRPWALWCGWPWINEVGHREGHTIVTQECHVNNMSEKELAGHLIHEYLHIVGYDHPYAKKYAVQRMTTIPYYVGDQAIEILNKSNNGG